MKHPFIRKAKKNSYLMDLIDRHRKWKMTRGEESESDSDGESGGETTEDPDTDWIMTVKVHHLVVTASLVRTFVRILAKTVSELKTYYW